MAESIRPTKKQRELLEFIQSFINQHNYSPSYREIMAGLHYTSVATVALHVNNLIKRGHLIRRDGKARSLEVAATPPPVIDDLCSQSEAHEAWLLAETDRHFKAVEEADERLPEHINGLESLVEALSLLEVDMLDLAFEDRLQALHE